MRSLPRNDQQPPGQQQLSRRLVPAQRRQLQQRLLHLRLEAHLQDPRRLGGIGAVAALVRAPRPPRPGAQRPVGVAFQLRGARVRRSQPREALDRRRAHPSQLHAPARQRLHPGATDRHGRIAGGAGQLEVRNLQHDRPVRLRQRVEALRHDLHQGAAAALHDAHPVGLRVAVGDARRRRGRRLVPVASSVRVVAIPGGGLGHGRHRSVALGRARGLDVLQLVVVADPGDEVRVAVAVARPHRRRPEAWDQRGRDPLPRPLLGEGAVKMEAQVVELRGRLPLELRRRVDTRGRKRHELHRGRGRDVVGPHVPRSLANAAVDVVGEVAAEIRRDVLGAAAGGDVQVARAGGDEVHVGEHRLVHAPTTRAVAQAGVVAGEVVVAGDGQARDRVVGAVRVGDVVDQGEAGVAARGADAVARVVVERVVQRADGS